MNPVEIIEKTRDGRTLTHEEMHEWIQAYVQKNIPDYQMAAWLMAVYFKGLTKKETYALTDVMRQSGRTLSFPDHLHILDKHSTGGVADTTSLIVAPLVAAAGGKVGKMSGRGLGFTGGTLDKLEAIPGVRVRLSESEFRKQIEGCGIAIIGQSYDFAPADGMLYALRDVTGTVESLPLIAASIMSKKLAMGANGIVLDVKCGRAAFMKSPREARLLADLMVEIGNQSGRKTVAVVSDMNVPLGNAIGNSLEIDEAIEVLSGGGNRRLKALCCTLTGMMLQVGSLVRTMEEGIVLAERILASGAGLEKFSEWIAHQGGATDWIGRRMLTDQLNVCEVLSPESGYITNIDPLVLARIAMHLGAGRQKKEDRIDPQVGIYITGELGNYIKKGDLLARVYGKRGADLDDIIKEVEAAFNIALQAQGQPLIYEIVGLSK